MKVLLTVHQFFPEFSAGTEVLTLSVARVLKALGHEVRVFTGYPATEALAAFKTLAQSEGIISAFESAHALAHAMKLAAQEPDSAILVGLSGRGDKDVAQAERLLA